jgi:TBC1 domain family member 24
LFTAKKQPLKNFNDIKQLIQQGKKREVKLLIRENTWPVNSTVRSQLWPELCAIHQHGKNMVDGFYWDMVNQVRLSP